MKIAVPTVSEIAKGQAIGVGYGGMAVADDIPAGTFCHTVNICLDIAVFCC